MEKDDLNFGRFLIFIFFGLIAFIVAFVLSMLLFIIMGNPK